MIKKPVERPTGDYDIATEIENLKAFLDRSHLTIDPNFYSLLKENDIIEAYSIPDNIQTYCNPEFLRICSYTPEQLAHIPYTQLFWRSEKDNLGIVQRATRVALEATGATGWDLPAHELVEALHPRKRTFVMQMGSICPCFDRVSGERRGFVSTVQVEFIFEWSENLD